MAWMPETVEGLLTELVQTREEAPDAMGGRRGSEGKSRSGVGLEKEEVVICDRGRNERKKKTLTVCGGSCVSLGEESYE